MTLINSLESVQGFAAKMCTKTWSARSSQLFSSLHWPSLRSRRNRLKAQLSRRIIRNDSILPSSLYHPAHHRNPRTSNSMPVSVPFARTTCFKSSFFVSSCRIWNSLPDNVISLTSPRSFKAALLQLPAFSI